MTSPWGGWAIARRTGTAAQHHAAVHDPITQRKLVICEVSGPSLVLGSTQPDEFVDRTACAHRGLTVVRRRTGGGAVVVRPEHAMWVDLALPRDDPLWVDDVSRSAEWVGRAWSQALRALGVEATIHGGDPLCSRWGRLCCFAGIDRFEVRSGAKKVVGISQRRRRDGARFQTLAYVGAHDPTEVVDVLAVDDADRTGLRDHLRTSVLVLDRGRDDLVEAFVSSLRRR